MVKLLVHSMHGIIERTRNPPLGGADLMIELGGLE